MRATYFVYPRFLAWPPDGQYLYYQNLFSKKGRPKNREEEKLFQKIPSIIPNEEVACAILYTRNQIIWPNGKRTTIEEICEEEGYDPWGREFKR